MAPRLSGQTSIFGVAFFVSKSLLGIEGQKKLEKFAILTRKPRSHARILIYRTWPIIVLLVMSLIRLLHENDVLFVLLLSPKNIVHFITVTVSLGLVKMCNQNLFVMTENYKEIKSKNERERDEGK